MKNELSPATLNLVASVVIVVAAVLGLGYWFYNTVNVPKPEVAQTEYPVGVLSEFDSTGVFIKTKDLKAPGGGQVVAATPIPLSSGDVGKKDLGSLE